MQGVLIVDSFFDVDAMFESEVARLNYPTKRVADYAHAIDELNMHSDKYFLCLINLKIKRNALGAKENQNCLQNITAIKKSIPVLLLLPSDAPTHSKEALIDLVPCLLLKPVKKGAIEKTILQFSARKNDLPNNKRSFIPLPNYLRSYARFSPYIVDIVQQVDHISKIDLPVLIEGDIYTGKGMVAREIHQVSRGNKAPIVRVDCGVKRPRQNEALGALKQVEATFPVETQHFMKALGGTLVLDNVGLLSKAHQLILLQKLEAFFKDSNNKNYARLRIISTSVLDMTKECRSGRFREDLYNFIARQKMLILPLRERKDDVVLIARLFAGRFEGKGRSPFVIELSEEIQDILTDFDWPGNHFQLRNAIEQAMRLAKGRVMKTRYFSHISLQLQMQKDRQQNKVILQNSENVTSEKNDNSIFDFANLQMKIANDLKQITNLGEFKSISMFMPNGKAKTIAEIEAEAIRYAIVACRGSMSKAARNLGIGRSTLYRKLREYDINPDEIPVS